MKAVTDVLLKKIRHCGVDRCYCVAYSGGVDSHVLLHAMTEVAKQVNMTRLRAVHVNHQLQSDAGQWERHCVAVCQQLDLPLIVEQLLIEKQAGESLEAVAREARYDVIARVLEEGEVLLTAHHQDDQAETLLLQLLRGAGVKGLASMPLRKTLGKGILLRPLLNLSRQDLMQYANAHELQWVEDESNSSLDFNRNYLRHQVMPILKSRWPQCAKTLSRSAGNCAAADTLIEDLAQMDLQQCLLEGTSALSVKSLLALSEYRRHQLCRYWMRQCCSEVPDAKQLLEINKMLLARVDAQACVSVGRVELRRHLDHLHIIPALAAHDVTEVIQWRLEEDCPLPNGLGCLSLSALKQQLPGDSKINILQVRFRQGGERVKLPGRSITHRLKKLFNDWGVPPWQRDRIPLLFDGDRLVMVWGFTGYLQ